MLVLLALESLLQLCNWWTFPDTQDVVAPAAPLVGCVMPVSGKKINLAEGPEMQIRSEVAQSRFTFWRIRSISILCRSDRIREVQ